MARDERRAEVTHDRRATAHRPRAQGPEHARAVGPSEARSAPAPSAGPPGTGAHCVPQSCDRTDRVPRRALGSLRFRGRPPAPDARGAQIEGRAGNGLVAPPAADAPARHPNLALLVVVFGVLITAIDTTIVVLALPEVQRSLRLCRPVLGIAALWVVVVAAQTVSKREAFAIFVGTDTPTRSAAAFTDGVHAPF